MLKFLDTSRHYVAAEHISSFPQDGELAGEGEESEGEGRDEGGRMGRGKGGKRGEGNGKEHGENGEWREDWKQGMRVGWRKRYTVCYGIDVVTVLLLSSPTF